MMKVDQEGIQLSIEESYIFPLRIRHLQIRGIPRLSRLPPPRSIPGKQAGLYGKSPPKKTNPRRPLKTVPSSIRFWSLIASCSCSNALNLKSKSFGKLLKLDFDRSNDSGNVSMFCRVGRCHNHLLLR